MTAAKVMDVNARQPDCDGQTAVAVLAYTQVEMNDVRMSWFSDTRSTTYMDENLGQTSDILVGRTVRGSSGSEKVPNWECLFVHRKQGLFF